MTSIIVIWFIDGKEKPIVFEPPVVHGCIRMSVKGCRVGSVSVLARNVLHLYRLKFNFCVFVNTTTLKNLSLTLSQTSLLC